MGAGAESHRLRGNAVTPTGKMVGASIAINAIVKVAFSGCKMLPPLPHGGGDVVSILRGA